MGRPQRPPLRRYGLRPRLTLLATVLVALVSGLLLWLGWLLVGGVARAVPALPPGSTVRVGNLDVPAEQLSEAVGAAARAEVLRAGLIAFPLVVVAAGLVSWVLVGRVLAPLLAVTATARRLSAESLDERTGLRDARGEVAELAAGFDAMLDRLQAAFDAQRRFVANAGHELRTPLAVLHTEVDVTLADPDAEIAELRRMGEVVRAAARRADALVGGLLLLARAQGGEQIEHRPVDVAELVRAGVATLRGEAACGGLRVRARGSAAPTTGDRVLLERLVGNLLENAVRHNVTGGWVEICTAIGPDGRAELRVASSGPEIAPEAVPELFEPFRRGPRERTAEVPGSGLGLSIVRAVVAAHGGTVRGEPVPGGGLAVTVRLPASASRGMSERESGFRRG
ncbi:sensor histidine kinase [Pseudonocardia asaccharolytica]|uniref:histidine kinase n=1 Tax=Pseudonocardia asaccharolytica DSM 44247 = NBRC 16224 TaxID=1123024 RepID=A0A511CYG4_9PSEU|nr:HAMP domain-containing sensor histidine kinase [Pseudonocardia asaccharolytica]GEL17606.1 two-component sensor histidine kinase [Pseudonocardia asaccharolytica DSM 44247 = NBRC 16224]